ALWRGESVAAKSGDGREIDVKIYPPPIQRAPKVWITSGGSPETFAMAGRMGACILTNLLVQTPEEPVERLALYRQAWRDAGHAGEGPAASERREGHVTLMLHTYVGRSDEEVRAKVRAPFVEYLRTSTDLVNKARWELTGFAKADDRTAKEVAGSMDLA